MPLCSLHIGTVCQINEPGDGKSIQDVNFLKRPVPREQTRHVFFFLAHSAGVITAGVRAEGNSKAAQSLSCNKRDTPSARWHTTQYSLDLPRPQSPQQTLHFGAGGIDPASGEVPVFERYTEGKCCVSNNYNCCLQRKTKKHARVYTDGCRGIQSHLNPRFNFTHTSITGLQPKAWPWVGSGEQNLTPDLFHKERRYGTSLIRHSDHASKGKTV